MHRVVYILLFTFLGVLLSFFLHGLIEMGLIALLTKDFSTYSLGLSWAQWFTIHHIGSITLFIAGILLGFWQGIHWYKIIYRNRK